ncbi:MAG: hypothetical protein FJ125_06065 [Deltaproteobacteria bacterium]|nr:hypothetical protein [Deltaproteobacteria bacterium]
MGGAAGASPGAGRDAPLATLGVGNATGAVWPRNACSPPPGGAAGQPMAVQAQRSNAGSVDRRGEQAAGQHVPP